MGLERTFKRTRLGVVLPEVRSPPPLEKGKSLSVLQSELEDHQFKEIDTVLLGLERRIERALTSLPSQPLPRLLDKDGIPQPWSYEAVRLRVREAIASETGDIDDGHPLTPVDELAISIEVVESLFPDDASVYLAWARLLQLIVDRIQAALERQVVKDRGHVSTLVPAVEARSPERPAALSPRAKFERLKRVHPKHSCHKEPARPFELVDKDAYDARAASRRIDAPQVAGDNSYRQVRRCRAFPPTKVPKDEYIQKVSNYCPVEARFDLRSVSLNMDMVDAKQPWTVVEFPKARPLLTKEQVGYLMEWQGRRYEKLEAAQATETECHAKLLLVLSYAESIVYELSRLVFDKCPSSCHFLYGLWHGVSGMMTTINKTIEDELVVLNQTLKTLKVEVDQLESKYAQQDATMTALHAKLQHRHKIIAAEREHGIRLRNALNKYLAADQILVRQTGQLIQTIFDVFPDQPRNATRHFTTTEAVEELRRTLDTKFNITPSSVFPRAFSVPAAPIDENTMLHGHPVVSSYEIETMGQELRATLKRLSLLTTLSSPDCSLGWDPQTVWQHAFFIPPIQELLEMESQLLEMVATVEGHLATRRRRRVARGSQTETISAAFRKGHAAKHIKNAVRMAAKAHVLSRRAEDGPVKRPGELKKLVPVAFQPFVQRLRAEYVGYDYTVGATHRTISFVVNELLAQLAGDVASHDGIPKAPMPREMVLLTPQEVVYRVFLERFRIPRFANERLMDLLTSLSHLDTQSEKIHLWCRLLGLAGVEALPPMAFWFVLHAIHVLAKSSHDGYFLIENDEVEYVGQQQSWDALTTVLGPFPADVLVRCKTKVTGLTQIYGTMWIPLYAVLGIVVEEWEGRFFAVKLHIETHFAQALAIDTFATFRSVVSAFYPKVHVAAVARAYHCALQLAASARPKPLHCSVACLDAGVVPADALAQFDKTLFLFAAPSDGMQLKQADLTFVYLKNVWAATHGEILRGIERHAHLNSSAGLRLVTPLEHILRDEPLQAPHAWHLLHQLVHIAHAAHLLS
ncbi:hypothetical protein ACHHYP_16535 [Achlya hypogyna]|uniref:Uncharacterized protein n=1 Tax=Achlya hypogyna TaxID=1202772 RepID=A0A1V9ZDY5_ACHHY|nr:hypothetical protein ACHHYP_16535 [Achlya hypogyna]